MIAVGHNSLRVFFFFSLLQWMEGAGGQVSTLTQTIKKHKKRGRVRGVRG